MNRRAALAAAGSGVGGLLGGCLTALPPLGEPDPPRLTGLRALNWHTEAQVLTVRIESDEDVVYDETLRLPAGDPTTYYTPGRDPGNHPTDLPPSVLYAWTDSGSKDAAATFDFGETPYDECVGLQLEICPVCASQKGAAEPTIPASPDVQILSTSNCSFPG